jgi:methyltransferase (TIGR00027 family)
MAPPAVLARIHERGMMNERAPSRTALAAAMHRAAHQVLEGGRIFADPLALRILGMEAEAVAQRAAAYPGARGMRLFIALRSACAESALIGGVEARGVRQAVILGAGLDTFAYRHPLGDRLRVFEVDHPATQAWKRQRLAEAGIAAPAALVFAPVDFERDHLLGGLEAKGFDLSQRTFFTWLGVVPYLEATAVVRTLVGIAGLRGGSEVVFDYGEPPSTLPSELRMHHEALAARVAVVGEPFKSYFEPAPLATQLGALGFTWIEDWNTATLLERHLGPEDAASPLARGAVAALRRHRGAGGHVVFAATSTETRRQ